IEGVPILKNDLASGSVVDDVVVRGNDAIVSHNKTRAQTGCAGSRNLDPYHRFSYGFDEVREIPGGADGGAGNKPSKRTGAKTESHGVLRQKA
ncbi:MAG: hypothetical protein WCH40_12390, partial [Verrucomicrobiales bacterium]